MDPDECLAMIRNRINELHSPRSALYWKESAAEAAELFDKLDDWITNGGFLPAAWSGNRKVGRRRHLQDGPVLEGVVHGKRSSYNQGCRCIPCTTANRTGFDTNEEARI